MPNRAEKYARSEPQKLQPLQARFLPISMYTQYNRADTIDYTKVGMYMNIKLQW